MATIHKHPSGTYSVRWTEQLGDKTVRIRTTRGFLTRAAAGAYLAARGLTLDEPDDDTLDEPDDDGA